jgi:hypothetical protein
MTMIDIKIHYLGKELMVAACDSNLLGKRFKEGKIVLNASKEFYGNGFKGNGERLKKELGRATIANLTGEEAVSSAIEAGFIDEERVIKVKGIPHAQYLLIK